MDALARRRQVAEQTEAFGDLSTYDPDKRKRYAAYSWPEVTYLVYVGLGFNISHGMGPQTYWQLFSALNLTIINQVLAAFDAPNATFRPGQYLLIELAHTVLGVAVEHLLAFLEQDRAWAKGVFGFEVDAKPVHGRRGRVVQVQFYPHVPANSGVSMFKAKVPAQVYAEALELLKYQVLELVSVDLLDDAFIVDRATDGIFGRLHVPGGLHACLAADRWRWGLTCSCSLLSGMAWLRRSNMPEGIGCGWWMQKGTWWARSIAMPHERPMPCLYGS